MISSHVLGVEEVLRVVLVLVLVLSGADPGPSLT